MKHRLMAAAVAVLAVMPLAHAQQPSPAQVQAKPPLTAGQQSYDQLDADLHALVTSINARLQAVNDDMTQLRQHVDKATVPSVAETKHEPGNSSPPAPPPHKPGTAKP